MQIEILNKIEIVFFFFSVINLRLISIFHFMLKNFVRFQDNYQSIKISFRHSKKKTRNKTILYNNNKIYNKKIN